MHTYYTSFILNKILICLYQIILYYFYFLQTIHKFLSKSVHCAPHSPLLSKSIHCAPHSPLLSKAPTVPPLTILKVSIMLTVPMTKSYSSVTVQWQSLIKIKRGLYQNQNVILVKMFVSMA